MGVAIDVDDGGPWLVVISLAVVIDRPKGDENSDDDGNYRPSSRRPNSADSKLRWRLQQRMRLRLPVAAPFRWNRPQRIGQDDDQRLVKATTIDGSFRRSGKSNMRYRLKALNVSFNPIRPNDSFYYSSPPKKAIPIEKMKYPINNESMSEYKR